MVETLGKDRRASMLAQLPCLGLSLTLRFTKFELLRLNGQCGGVKK